MKNLLSVLVAGVFCVGSFVTSASGQQSSMLRLKSSQRWLYVAQTNDIDKAIGIARNYSGFGSKVVKSVDGQFSVVMGPYRAQTIKGVFDSKETGFELPADAALTKGKDFVGVVWQSTDSENEPAEAENLLSPYVLDRPLKLESDPLTVEVKMATVGNAAGPTTVTGLESGKQAFQFTLNSPEELSSLGATAGFVRLDKNTDYPQLVVTRNSAGAHCCTKTWFISKPKGSADWIVVEGESLNGGGYDFPDLNADGTREIVNTDNRFLSTFDTYAASYAPKLYNRLDGNSLKSVNDSIDVAGNLKQDLASIEFGAKIDPELWKSNGFLAGWVASKIRLGEGEEAWTTMMENYNKQSEFGQEECTTGQSVDNCPVGNMKPQDFPRDYARFLQENGYTPLPQAALSYAQ